MATISRTRKTERKSSKIRVAIALSGEWSVYAPSEDDWRKLELAIGRKIASELRAQTIQIVQIYFRKQPFEQNAPFLDDVLKQLSVVSKAADHLLVILQKISEDQAGGIARAQIVSGLEVAEPDPVDQIYHSLERLSRASEIAKREFQENKHEGFIEGDAWQEMIRSIRILMRSRSMPTGASQDDLRSRTSPFVRFVKSLQETFPLNLRRHHSGGLPALAKKINRAGWTRRVGT